MASHHLEDLEVIYIAGNGHSGSTLLDIVLGDREGFFSAGELSFCAREGIFEEFCSCGSTIKDCPVWNEIYAQWSLSRPLSLETFRTLRHRYERNKTLPRLLANIVKPSKDFELYCASTKLLFEAIQIVTGASVIIDSSKSPSRILMLKRIADLKVVHLCRNFKGVMNSTSKFHAKDLARGIEEDLKPMSSHRAFINWLVNNLLVEILSAGVKRVRIKYRDLVSQPETTLKRVDQAYVGTASKEYFAEHILAGNVIRLRKKLKVDGELGFSYKNLTPSQLRFGKAVDRVFKVWS